MKRLGIGFDINAMNEDEIINFIESLNEDVLYAKSQAAKDIDKRKTLNINKHLFNMLESFIENNV